MWADVYVIEKKPKSTGLQVHGWQHGSPVDQDDLGDAAAHVGFLPDVYGEPRRLSNGTPLRYLLKGALYEPARMMPPSAQEFLVLNRHLVHSTHSFWRHWNCGRISTRRQAEQVARARRAPGAWVMTTVAPLGP